ncbi:MAG: DMT family transporter [Cyanobacteria bacterium J06631_2]
MNFVYILVAILAGIVFAIQPVINDNVARNLGNPLQAALISFFVGTVVLLVLSLLMGTKIPSIDKLSAIPWWLYLAGGTIGAFVVTAALIIQPKIGAGVWVSGYVFGQLTMSILLDNFGLLGLEVHPISFMRGLGAFLLVVGAILVANY